MSEVRRQAEAEKEIAIAETKKKKWVMKALMCHTVIIRILRKLKK